MSFPPRNFFSRPRGWRLLMAVVQVKVVKYWQSITGVFYRVAGTCVWDLEKVTYESVPRFINTKQFRGLFKIINFIKLLQKRNRNKVGPTLLRAFHASKIYFQCINAAPKKFISNCQRHIIPFNNIYYNL
jgi:hypothetical protein